MTKRILFLFSVLLLASCRPTGEPNTSEDHIVDFATCVAAGNAVMESYPRQCRTAGGKHFVEEVEIPIER